MARRKPAKKHRKLSGHPYDTAGSVHDRPTYNPSAPPVALTLPPEPEERDPEAAFFETDSVHEDNEPLDEAYAVPAKIFRLEPTRSTRSRFLPMVKIVITSCAFLIAIGGVRSAVARSHHTGSISHATNSDAAPPVVAALPASSTENRATLAIPPASAARASERALPTMPSTSATTLANDLVKASQAKLESGNAKLAIELGEQAVELDPTNARGWLMLGAAYQSRGNTKDAWRCYHACVDHGTGRARSECAAMLR